MSVMTDLGIDPDAVEEALQSGHTFPARWYSDPRIYEIELERIFTRTWHLVGPLHKVEQPGDHMVCQVAQIPILVVRSEEGTLRGFVNVCRHRAHPVAREDGNRKTLQCRYHAWTYDLDGSLRAAPRSEREASFDKADFSLLPVKVDTWAGFVLVNPDPDASPFRETHPEFEPMAAERKLDISGYRYVDRYEYEISANWKVWVENATECYHCPTVHSKSFSDAFEVEPGTYEYVNTGQLLGQFTPYNRSGALGATAGGNGTQDGEPAKLGFRFIYFWPTSFVAQDDYVAFPGMIIPTSPVSCRFIADFFVHPDCDEQFGLDWVEMYNQTLREDSEVVRAQQPGLSSRMVPFGRLMPASESSIAYFHRVYWRALSEALSESGAP
jgi:phenylpropionate dioxygenase-like ring-hydroxylating dioxygenase large terminal subunit